MKKQIIFLSASLWFFTNSPAQESSPVNPGKKDSLYLTEVEHKKEPVKVLHAEPLYIDLIRDLGARKGEKEWNLAFGLTDNYTYDKYTALVEYEWAPADRLGLEVELPFSIYYASDRTAKAPYTKLNSLKLAAQYSFFVSDKHKTSLAAGYIHEFELAEIKHYSSGRVYEGNVFNPFVVAAKRWGNNIHSLLYTGPVIQKPLAAALQPINWQVNTSFHYMIPSTRNFVGVEFNKEIQQQHFNMIIRPQMRVCIAHNMMAGIVTGIPVRRENERISSFVRLIYEPGHKKSS